MTQASIADFFLAQDRLVFFVNAVKAVIAFVFGSLQTVRQSVHHVQVALDCVMVCGGGSRCPGITQRLCRQLRSMLPPSTPPCAVALPEYMPQASTFLYAPWIGGGLLAKACIL